MYLLFLHLFKVVSTKLRLIFLKIVLHILKNLLMNRRKIKLSIEVSSECQEKKNVMIKQVFRFLKRRTLAVFFLNIFGYKTFCIDFIKKVLNKVRDK